MKLNHEDDARFAEITNVAAIDGRDDVIKKLAELGEQRLERRIETEDWSGHISELLQPDDVVALRHAIGVIAEQCTFAANVPAAQTRMAGHFFDTMISAAVALCGLISAQHLAQQGEEVIGQAITSIMEKAAAHPSSNLATDIEDAAREIADALGLDTSTIGRPDDDDPTGAIHDLLVNMKSGVEHA